MTRKGFTLVELMVVVGVLSIMMLVISQPLASVIKYQRESQTSDNMRDNLQFVINKMEKELKTSSDVSENGSTLEFLDQNGSRVELSRTPNVKYSLNETNEIMRNGQKLTDASIFKVTGLNFNINDNELVTIIITAQSLDNKDTVTMQTSVLPLND
jgi:prepilin-type N-terminal cleavage/methylation domain-containing protein